MIENENGQSEIAAISLLVNEKKIYPCAVFPNAALIICLFHTPRTFSREIMCDKWNITFNERDSLKEIIQDIILYCKSELEYDNNLYQHFSTVALETVNEWIIGLICMTQNFMNKTNNRLESFNEKLKSVISCFSLLEYFVEK
ncbi:zinc finger SWIM domain-containing protein 3-like [Aphis craccivora]|uniref:Zinc finger SWIM domain-containing protein 3-like n=1 Tax=Aphis craccivora TaxID=307492 RepID=A0A6G0Y810_APHCR|nr:zinc finger SWIM domain-containing protein 3-like [Aphis craccivora]